YPPCRRSPIPDSSGTALPGKPSPASSHTPDPDDPAQTTADPPYTWYYKHSVPTPISPDVGQCSDPPYGPYPSSPICNWSDRSSDLSSPWHPADPSCGTHCLPPHSHSP